MVYKVEDKECDRIVVTDKEVVKVNDGWYIESVEFFNKRPVNQLYIHVVRKGDDE